MKATIEFKSKKGTPVADIYIVVSAEDFVAFQVGARALGIESLVTITKRP